MSTVRKDRLQGTISRTAGLFAYIAHFRLVVRLNLRYNVCKYDQVEEYRCVELSVT